MFLLDNTILDLIHEGRAGALRDLFKNLDVPLARRDLTDAERHSDRLVFLHVGQFGSFFWRMIHWMGEAVNVKKEQDDPDVKLAIRIWKNFALESMYRLLRCSICMMHLRMLTQELKSQLMDETVDYARLWYNIHNRVNSDTFKRFAENAGDTHIYPEEIYKTDADYMHQAFLP